ncbi:MAG: transcriptional regulator TbsP domain-containing protein, partial [Halobacteriota archaeon]
MSATLIERSMPALFDRINPVTDEEVLVVNPSRTTIGGLVEWGVEQPGELPHIRLLAEEWTLKSALGTFTIASRAADLIEAERLHVRFVADPPKTSFLTDGDRLFVLLESGERVGGLESTDQPLVGDLFEENAERFRHAEDYRLHTPPISRIESTLAERAHDRPPPACFERHPVAETQRGVTLAEVDPDHQAAASHLGHLLGGCQGLQQLPQPPDLR